MMTTRWAFFSLALAVGGMFPATSLGDLFYSENFDTRGVGTTLADIGSPWGGNPGNYAIVDSGQFGVAIRSN